MHTGTTVHRCVFDTPMGPCGLAWSDGAVVALCLPDTDRAAIAGDLRRRYPDSTETLPDAFARDVVDRLRDYHIARERIYARTQALGWGLTATYGEIARDVGAPDAARAVGTAMGRNPVPVIIPCHRVLAAGNTIGGFSAPGGTATKLSLLAMEGVRLGHPDTRQLSLDL